MKRKRIIICLLIVMIIVNALAIMSIKEVWPDSPLKGKGTARLNDHSEVVLTIKKNMKCTPVSLSLYDDNTYELFTEYEGCRPFQSCIMRLYYTKSIKGTYDYDLTKILDNSIRDEDITFDDELIDYKITTGPLFGETPVLDEKYGYYMVIKKGESNIYLEEFLKEIDVDLDLCAIPDYD